MRGLFFFWGALAFCIFFDFSAAFRRGQMQAAFSYYIIEIMWYERLPSGYPRGSGWRGIVRQGGW